MEHRFTIQLQPLKKEMSRTRWRPQKWNYNIKLSREAAFHPSQPSEVEK
jgi:hypothetical protein